MDFGAHLRQARESKGISLRDVAEETKISMVALEALERNDVGRLPGGIFTRAFVRAYASHVGLDADQALQQFLDQFPEEAGEASLEPHGSSSEGEAIGGGGHLVAWLMLLAVPVVAGALYLWNGSTQPEAQPPVASERARTSAPSRTPAPVLPVPPESTSPARPGGAAAVSLPAPAVIEPPADAGDVLTVTIAPVGACWVSMLVDGERRAGRVMQAGERDVVRVRDELVVDIGDAGAFAFSINGAPARSLGGAGQVVKLRLTKANYRSYLSGG